MEEGMTEVGEKRKNTKESSNSPSHKNIYKKRIFSTQATINKMFNKGLREEACKAIVRFFCNNVIPFNVEKAKEFTTMFDLVSRYVLGFKPPSYHEIIVKYLKEEVTNTSLVLKAHRDEWKKTRGTIMTNGWTDNKRRTIINFLVNISEEIVFLKFIDASIISKTAEKVFEMMDNIVEEVGEDNIV